MIGCGGVLVVLVSVGGCAAWFDRVCVGVSVFLCCVSISCGLVRLRKCGVLCCV